MCGSMSPQSVGSSGRPVTNGKSLSDFVLTAAATAAEHVIDAHERVSLTKPDWDFFFTALVEPPEPNDELKAAVRRFRDR
jgi:uncharacterized protein (DUF1778 family)